MCQMFAVRRFTNERDASATKLQANFKGRRDRKKVAAKKKGAKIQDSKEKVEARKSGFVAERKTSSVTSLIAARDEANISNKWDAEIRKGGGDPKGASALAR